MVWSNEVIEEVLLDVAVSTRATQADILTDATPFPGADIDAAVSTRATQADILSDATPFPGADIDAAVSTRLAADGIGTVFSIVKSVVHSDIVLAGIDLTGVSTGLLELVTAYAQNGAVAMTSATNTAKLELANNNVRGSDLYLTDVAEANLGANTTNPLGNSICVLESGKKISALALSENFTSAGTVDIYLVFRRLAAGATIAAA
jgi:hypothetical protein